MDTIEDKEFFAKAWLEDLKRHIDRLPVLYENGSKLDNKDWKEEAFTLCIVYIDRLSNRFKPVGASHHRRFCEILIDFSQNNFFGKICFSQLLRNLKFMEEKKKKTTKEKDFSKIYNKVKGYFNLIGCDLDEEMYCKKSPPPQLYIKTYERDDVIFFLQNNSILTKEECALLDVHLWKGSIASICYNMVRCPTVHQYTQSMLTIENTTLDFSILYPALKNVYEYIEKLYFKEGKFLGFEAGEHPFSYTK